MRIQFASDLHLETRPKDTFEKLLVKGKAPILALLGDIAPLNHPNLRAFLEWCSERWEQIIYIPGVLELWDADRPMSETVLAENVYKLKGLCAPFLNMSVLYRESFYSSDGFVVLGCTFWSCIVTESKLLRKLHQADCDWISAEVKKYTNPFVVLSHYGPVGWVQHENGMETPETAPTFPQLELILRAPIVAWMFGHIHDTIEYTKVWSYSDGKPHSILLVSNGLGPAPPWATRGLKEEYRRDGVLRLDASQYNKVI
jgi:hypothetical protein